MSPSSASPAPTLQTLPPQALRLIIRHALGIPSGVLRPSASLDTLVSLCRTSPFLRGAVASSIRELRFSDDTPWPAVKILGPHAWPQLHVVHVTISRSCMLAFLKWLIPGTPHELRIRVCGEPYSTQRFTALERVLFGRLFTNAGPGLRVLSVEGIDCQALLFSAMFQCTALREISVKDYGDAAAPALISVMSILCLANRQCLQKVDAPWEEWHNRTDGMPDGVGFAKACKVTWETLWRSFRAGMKESAVNLPSGADELVAKYRQVSARMDALSDRMNVLWAPLEAAGENVSAEDVPMAILRKLIPGISSRPTETP